MSDHESIEQPWWGISPTLLTEHLLAFGIPARDVDALAEKLSDAVHTNHDLRSTLETIALQAIWNTNTKGEK
jgi:hypothetical protein